MAATIAGALVGRALGAYGKKPTIPTLQRINPDEILRQTSAGNLASLGTEEKIGTEVDQYNFDQLSKALDFWSPGSLGKLQQTLAAQLRGELSPDLVRSVTGSATAAGFGRGLGPSFGSPTGIGWGRVSSDLLLAGREEQQRGFNNLMQLQQFSPKPYDPTRQFFTSQQRYMIENEQNQQQFDVNLLNERVKAMPNPADVALAEGFDNFFKFWASVGGGALGGLGGAGGAKGFGGIGGASPSMNSQGMGLG